MWINCPQVLDEPVKLFGLEIEDFFCVLFVLPVSGLLMDTLPSFVLTGAIGTSLYLAKRGKPPGALLHGLHALELTRLPGILGPKPQRYSAW